MSGPARPPRRGWLGRWAFVLLFGLIAFAARPARGEPLGAEELKKALDQARSLYSEQEYARAIPVLRRVVQSSAATSADKVRAFEVLGLCYLILGQERLAREAFENLLALDPDHTLVEETQSPKIRRFFEQVKASFTPGYRAGPPVQIELEVPEQARGGRRLEVRVRVTRGVGQIVDVRLYYRAQGQLGYRAEPLAPSGPGRFEGAVVPAAEPSPWTLEYYVEARDRRGQVRSRAGEPLRPLGVRVEAVSTRTVGPPPWYRRWYIWAAVGAVAAGSVGIAVGSRGQSAPPGSLSPSIVRLK